MASNAKSAPVGLSPVRGPEASRTPVVILPSSSSALPPAQFVLNEPLIRSWGIAARIEWVSRENGDKHRVRDRWMG